MAATTDDTDNAEHTDAPVPAPAPPRRRGGKIALAVSVFGELLITAGLVLGLFVVYSLWWTNVVADRHADRQGDKVRDNWAGGDSGPGSLDTLDGIGFLHVPAMRNGEVLVEKGTSTKILNDGVAGYYTDPVKATLPTSGKKGNFTLAAHRDGHGAKFHNIDKLEKGDPIVFETKDDWYVYKVFAVLPETSKYNVEVLGAVPEESGTKKAGHYITLTTCTPVYTSRYRYVVWGELERVQKVDADRTPPKELD
ncbi:class E sortase [Streptomyces phaeofaciens JCM 4814]|uniref:Class E sortase n=1 Tax=Streptomyces phaeofaciens TaxID=68254 RepID=A0A918HQF4_9ACTN|nr:class E sortase [Streptomyces phaeofaciens]GGT95825.1 class E sortase [Streptomyces phaeofaciens]